MFWLDFAWGNHVTKLPNLGLSQKSIAFFSLSWALPFRCLDEYNCRNSKCGNRFPFSSFPSAINHSAKHHSEMTEKKRFVYIWGMPTWRTKKNHVRANKEFYCMSRNTHMILMIVSWTTIYAVYNAILLAEMRNWNPVLGAFPNIWLHERLAFSVLELLETVNFSAVLGAYEVKEQLPSGLFVVEMLVDGYSLFDIPLFCSAIDIFPLYMM